MLGQFRLAYQGVPVSGFHPLRLQALLAALLLNRESPLSRQQLAFRLWPDTSDGQARTNLRHLLHTLRSALPEAAGYLQSAPGTIGWNFSAPAFIDVVEFETAARRSDSVDSLQSAAALYQGSLLPDCHDDWIEPERSRLHELFLASLSALADHQAKAGNPAAALQTANQLLRSDPLRENTYCRLMEYHAALGDRAGVVRVFETCVSVLKAELGVEPGAETRSAYQAWLTAATPAVRELRAAEDVEGFSNRLRSRNLPVPLGNLVGREDQKRDVIEQINQHRLVTLTGFGGIGKTRLAQAISWESAGRTAPSGDLEEIWWIDLAPISASELMHQAIAAALHIPEQPGRPVVDSLLDALGTKGVLVVLDNCEHLLEPAAQFCLTLLTSCPAVRVLATSRVSLHLPGEVVHNLAPLTLPGPEAAALSESELLFYQRANATNPAFAVRPEHRAAVQSICRRLDGIPLAIELAAARIRMLTPIEIAERLDDAFRLLAQRSQAVLPRHQTMRAALDWSHTLLAEPEQQLLRRLSIFAGSFSLAAVEAIVPLAAAATTESADALRPADVLDLLAGLIEHSLVAVEETAQETRYRLHEVTRQYAAQRLSEAKEEAELQRNHLAYYVGFIQAAEAGIPGKDLIAWLRRVDREADNVRAAIEWGLSSRVDEEVRLGMELVGGIWLYWFIRARLEEGLHWAEKALAAAAGRRVPPGVTGKVLYTAASLALFQGLIEKAEVFTQGSLEQCQAAGDLIGIAISLHHKGAIASQQGEHGLAEQYYRESLAITRQVGNAFWECCLLIDLGDDEEEAGNLQQANQWFHESLTIARTTKNPFNLVYALINLAFVSIDLGEIRPAGVYATEIMAIALELDDPRVLAFTLEIQGEIAAQAGRFEEAEALWRPALQTYVETNDRNKLLAALEKLAWAASQQGDLQRAAYLLGASQSGRQRWELEWPPAEVSRVAQLQRLLGEQGDAALFEPSYQIGLTSSLEQAVGCALGADPPIGHIRP